MVTTYMCSVGSSLKRTNRQRNLGPTMWSRIIRRSIWMKQDISDSGSQDDHRFFPHYLISEIGFLKWIRGSMRQFLGLKSRSSTGDGRLSVCPLSCRDDAHLVARQITNSMALESKCIYQRGRKQKPDPNFDDDDSESVYYYVSNHRELGLPISNVHPKISGVSVDG